MHCILISWAIFLGLTATPELLTDPPWNGPKKWEHGVPTAIATAVPADGKGALKISPVAHMAQRIKDQEDTNTLTFTVVIAEFRDSAIGELGLNEFFRAPLAGNELMQEEIAGNALTKLSQQFTNVILDLSPLEVYAGKCSSKEADRILNLLRTGSNVDVLSCPKATTLAGREATVSVEDRLTIATGAEDSPAGLSKAPSGQLTRLWAALNDGSMQLEVTGSSMRFQGYASPKRQMKFEGKKVWLPEPMLQLTTVGIRTELHRDEILLLGTPVREQNVQTVDKVPWLSGIPLLGERIFTTHRTHTNQIRQLFIIRAAQPNVPGAIEPPKNQGGEE